MDVHVELPKSASQQQREGTPKDEYRPGSSSVTSTRGIVNDNSRPGTSNANINDALNTSSNAYKPSTNNSSSNATSANTKDSRKLAVEVHRVIGVYSTTNSRQPTNVDFGLFTWDFFSGSKSGYFQDDSDVMPSQNSMDFNKGDFKTDLSLFQDLVSTSNDDNSVVFSLGGDSENSSLTGLPANPPQPNTTTANSNNANNKGTVLATPLTTPTSATTPTLTYLKGGSSNSLMSDDRVSLKGNTGPTVGKGLHHHHHGSAALASFKRAPSSRSIQSDETSEHTVEGSIMSKQDRFKSKLTSISNLHQPAAPASLWSSPKPTTGKDCVTHTVCYSRKVISYISLLLLLLKVLVSTKKNYPAAKYLNFD